MKRINSSHVDQLIQVDFADLEQRAFASEINLQGVQTGRFTPNPGMQEVPKSLIDGKGTIRQKQTKLARTMMLFLDIYKDLLDQRVQIYYHPTINKEPNIMYLSFKNPRTKVCNILEMSLSGTRANLRLRCLAPKQKHKPIYHPQYNYQEQLYTILNKETFNRYV